MTKLDSLSEQIAALREKRRVWMQEIDHLDECIRNLQAERDRIEFDCPCVRRNGDIGLHTMNDYQFRFRESLRYGGLVSDTLSADKNCPVCHGSGKTGEAR